ncbi:MAG: metallophosphoesterase [Cyanobacteria bacterium P01_H01_bin.74]
MSQVQKRQTVFLMAGFSVILILAVLAWAYWWNDFDFDRPEQPLRCGVSQRDASLSITRDQRFIAFGDFGQGTPFQTQLGTVMGEVYREKPFATALLLGDNIYPDGNIKKYRVSRFEKPYADLIRNNVRFLAAIGDHDDRKAHLPDQMAYFKMPDKYYKVSHGNTDFFILNTTFFVRSPEQQTWIKKSLQDSIAQWKIVVGHHPLYSSGRNGNTEGLKKILEPLLIENQVDFYLSGHDHGYERFSEMQGVQYIVSGGGGSFLYSFKEPKRNGSVLRLRTHHFLLFEVDEHQLAMSVINRFGDTVDCIYKSK